MTGTTRAIQQRAAYWQQRVNALLAELNVASLDVRPAAVETMLEHMAEEGFEWIDATTMQGPARIVIGLYRHRESDRAEGSSIP